MYRECAIESSEDARNLLIERCRTDVEAFALAFFPHYCEYPFNKFHNDCFEDWRVPVRRTRWADAAPRGSAKSTLKALIKPIHDLCYHVETFIVLFSETDRQAVGKLKDIRSELLDNRLLIEHFGNFFRNRSIGEKEFVATCGGHECKFASYSAGAEVRGIRFKENRPSKLILDDAEDSNEVENEELRDKKENWFKQVISKLGNKKTNIDVVGTILHKKSMLMSIKENPVYKFRLYKAVISWSEREDLWLKWRTLYSNLDCDTRLADAAKFYDDNEVEMLRGTEVLWPDYEGYLDLMVEMIEIGRKAFFKERQNEPIAGDQSLFEDMHFFLETNEGFQICNTGVVIPWKELHGVFGVIDPATGQTKAKTGKLGDFTCICMGYTDTKGRLFVSQDWTKRATPTKFINQIFEFYELRNGFEKFGVETNLFRNLLLPNLERERTTREQANKAAGKSPWGIRIPFYDIENVENKHKRIYTLEPKVSNGYILFNKSLSQEFIGQMEAFPLGEHDDACFVAGTKVATPWGPRSIESLRVGESVVTPFGTRKITATGNRLAKVVSRVGLTGTPDHPVFSVTANDFVSLDGFEMLSQCSIFNYRRILNWRYRKLLYSTLSSTGLWGRGSIILANQQQIQGESILKDCMLRFGSFIAEGQYLKALSFITKTTTLLTTASITWSAYQLGNTQRTTRETLTSWLSHWGRRGKQLKSGTVARLAGCGILSSLKNLGRLGHYTLLPAHAAAVALKHPSLVEHCTVPPSAGSATTLRLGGLAKLESATSAVHNTALRSLNRPEHVQDNAGENFQTVYNLTVSQDGVYYANNILVSNCDALEMLWGLVNGRYTMSSIKVNAQAGR